MEVAAAADPTSMRGGPVQRGDGKTTDPVGQVAWRQKPSRLWWGHVHTTVLAGDMTAPYFANTNMAHLKKLQVEFMKIALTQIPVDLPVDVSGLLKERHLSLFKRMGTNKTNFVKVAEHFIGACHHWGVEQNLIDEAVRVIGPLRSIFEKAEIEYGKQKKHLSAESFEMDGTIDAVQRLLSPL